MLESAQDRGWLFTQRNRVGDGSWILAAEGCPEENCMSSTTLMVMPCTLLIQCHHCTYRPHEDPGESLTGTAGCLCSHWLSSWEARSMGRPRGYAEALSLLCPPVVPYQVTFSLILSWIIGMFMNQAHFSGNRIVYINTH